MKDMSPDGRKPVIHTNDWGTHVEKAVIVDNGAGFCMLSIPGKDDPPEHRDRVWLHDLSVLPDFRKRGIGGRLLRISAEIARQEGRKRLSLWVRPGTWMEEWYRRLGFRVDSDMYRDDGTTVYNIESKSL